MSQSKFGSGSYYKVARPIVVLPRDNSVPLLSGGQAKQRLGYVHIKTILLFHILHADLQLEINGEFPADGEYELLSKREVRTALEDELQIYDAVLEGRKFSALAAPETEYE